MKKVFLVLSGGGARGFAHIGVIKSLESHNIKPDIISGTSMGAIVGGLYSYGYSIEKIEKIARNFDWKEFAKFFILPTTNKNFIEKDGVLKFFRNLTGNTKIEDLEKKFYAVAFDLKNNSEIIIDKGDLASAMRASMSIPIVFTPFPYEDRLLFDGGLINPLPVDVIDYKKGDYIIAVNVLKKKVGKLSKEHLNLDLESLIEKNEERKEKLSKKIDSNVLMEKLKENDNYKKIKNKLLSIYEFFEKDEEKQLSNLKILEKIFYTNQNYIVQSRSYENIDIFYEPIAEKVNFFDFAGSLKLIDKAEREMDKILEDKKAFDIIKDN